MMKDIRAIKVLLLPQAAYPTNSIKSGIYEGADKKLHRHNTTDGRMLHAYCISETEKYNLFEAGAVIHTSNVTLETIKSVEIQPQVRCYGELFIEGALAIRTKNEDFSDVEMPKNYQLSFLVKS